MAKSTKINRLSVLYKSIDQTQLSEQAKTVLNKLRLATGNFRSKDEESNKAFETFYNKLLEKKPLAIRTSKEYKDHVRAKKAEIARKAREARKSKEESRQGQGSEKDANRPAKPYGWRLRGKHNYRKPTREQIRNGEAYYEGRVNRADVKRRKFPMLERGGYMEQGGATTYYYRVEPQTNLGGNPIPTRLEIKSFFQAVENSPKIGKYVEHYYYDFTNDAGYFVLNDKFPEPLIEVVMDAYNMKKSKYQYEKGGEINVVLNEGNGKTINKLFNDWNNIKTEKQYEKWSNDVKNAKFGTYGTISFNEVLENFEFDNSSAINSVQKNDFKKEVNNVLSGTNKFAQGGEMGNTGNFNIFNFRKSIIKTFFIYFAFKCLD
jgi:hypothetical protein